MVNVAIILGNLVKAPQVRALPSGLSVTSFDVRVRRYDLSADTVPVSVFTNAGYQLLSWEEGEELLVVGRVRRRFFRAGGSTQSRTEVVADRVVAVSDKSSVASALAEATNMLSMGLALSSFPTREEAGAEPEADADGQRV